MTNPDTSKVDAQVKVLTDAQLATGNAAQAAATAGLTAANAKLTAQVAGLTAQLAPPKAALAVGVAVTGQTPAALATLPFTPQLWRVYSTPGALPANWAASPGHLADGLGIAAWYSAKPGVPDTLAGKNDAWLASFLPTIPLKGKNGVVTMLTMEHEPENPSKNISGPDYVKFINYVGGFVRKYAPGLPFGPIYMDYQMRLQAAKWAYIQGINPDLIDFIGLDPYPNTVPYPQFIKADKAQALAGLGADKPFAMGELAWDMNQVPSKALAFQAAVAYERTQNTLAVCYYEPEPGSPRWGMSATELAALGGMVKANAL